MVYVVYFDDGEHQVENIGVYSSKMLARSCIENEIMISTGCKNPNRSHEINYFIDEFELDNISYR